MFEKMLEEKQIRPIIELQESLDKLSSEIIKTNKTMFNAFYTIIDQQLYLIYLNTIVMNYKNHDFAEIMCSLCYKNLISIFSSIKLLKDGFLGTAKIIFRNVYESLLTGKLIGITNDYKYYEKWKTGEQFSMKKDIFSKLINEPSKEILEFWDILNKYNHSTIYAQDFELEINKNEIENCNVFIFALLDMNFHLLNSFVSKYYNYYLNYYFKGSYTQRKKDLNSNLSIVRKTIDKRCKKVISEYKAEWILR